MLECKTVTLRTRPLKHGMLSFYLDYYPGYRDQETMKTIRHEGLNIYIYANPKNERERNFNATMSEKAEAIRCRRFESIVNDRYDFFDRHKLKADFLEYYRKQLRKHDQKWEFVYHHFYNFVHGKCTFEEIDIDLCNKFREYLLNAKQLRRDDRISKNSASGYWSTFRGLLKILYRNRLIKTNINDFLDKIETEDTPKDYLSVEELYKLAETPCKKPILKTAALFSCLTSLRISDILSLQWHEIIDFAAGGKCVHTITQKTKTEDIIPISDEALQLIGYSPEKTGLVFKGLKRVREKLVKSGYDCSGWILDNEVNDGKWHSYNQIEGKIKDPDGVPVNVVVKSAKGGYIYLSATDFEFLTQDSKNLLLVWDGDDVHSVSGEDLFTKDSNVNLIFDTEYTPKHYYAALSKVFQYVKRTTFAVKDPKRNTYSQVQGFGMDAKTEGIQELFDDNDL